MLREHGPKHIRMSSIFSVFFEDFWGPVAVLVVPFVSITAALDFFDLVTTSHLSDMLRR